MHYASKVGKGDFRLARVDTVHPDKHGVVRTVTVKMRPRDGREKVSAAPPHLRPKAPTLLSLGVQRICMILPVEEQRGGQDDAFHGFSNEEIQQAQGKAAVLRGEEGADPDGAGPGDKDEN